MMKYQFYWYEASAYEKGEKTIGLFLDFLKAFDTVNHNILFKKLEHYGIRGIVLKWFQNYLSYRTQCYLSKGIIARIKY